MTQEELDDFLKKYRSLASEARKRVRKGMPDIGTPDVRKSG
jgi:hypothetical protein